ncbi:hypothetical protein GRS96_03490 [Rathayibacter sp. VKM Ac-2803]|uniref:hypothetical protein n=1 Tax=unclassified Rathayibacter TaxID=2609250 RepID=UPI00135CF562|nr:MULTISPECIES: hypothetical protein [unclassified Rathayibacter]MWV48339.1 hypothetical protein [Rathayibacter sp. VKM Ac-2803]MWV59169.1 hypothetical protein [Rathayibacter sp. VKM Ac-2754]
MTPSRIDLAAALAAADVSAAARLDAHITTLWDSKPDPDATRSLLRELATELADVRARLNAALNPAWWTEASSDVILQTYEDAQVWTRSNPDCDELTRLFVQVVRSRT